RVLARHILQILHRVCARLHHLDHHLHGICHAFAPPLLVVGLSCFSVIALNASSSSLRSCSCSSVAYCATGKTGSCAVCGALAGMSIMYRRKIADPSCILSCLE